MNDLVTLYKVLEFERNKLLNHFRDVDEELFYKKILAESWSSEQIFRHLLMGVRWMSGMLPGDPIETPSLALLPDKSEERQKYTPANLDEIISQFNESSPKILEQFESMTDEQANEQVQTRNFPVVRKINLIMLISHEYKHHGQIILILKQLANWTDDELFKITFSESVWDTL